jgi:hypothetical protein
MTFNLLKIQQVQQSPDVALYEWAIQNLYIEPGTPPEAIVEMAQKAQQQAQTANQVADIMLENTGIQEEQAENTQEMKNIIPQSVPTPGGAPVQGSKDMVFNLKKAQFGEPITPVGDLASDNVDMMGDQLDMQQNVLDPENSLSPESSPQFQSGSDFKDWLDQKDYNSAKDFLLNHVADISSQQIIEDGLKSFYEDDLSQNNKIKVASTLFDFLPNDLKVPDENDPGMISAPYVSARVEEISDVIKKMAEEIVKKTEHKSFNITKQAQHKVVEDTFMYGPSQTRIDPFYRMPVSDYHIVERNKGYGIDFGGVWDVDWEALWRGSVMDKYSRPYKDKDGNWVGGYIQKRFEVDKNIPEQNNLQLKPGQKRKPILPQYGNIGSRLEYMRANEDRGYEPVSTGNPTDWNELTTAPFNLKQATKKKS